MCVVIFATWAYHAMQDTTTSSEGMATKTLAKEVSKARKSTFFGRCSRRSSKKKSKRKSRETTIELNSYKGSNFSQNNPMHRSEKITRISKDKNDRDEKKTGG